MNLKSYVRKSGEMCQKLGLLKIEQKSGASCQNQET